MLIPLRDYQRDAAIAAIHGFFRETDGEGPYDKQLLVEPTGSGKTVIFSAMSEYWLTKRNERVLILCDQTDLCGQAAEELQKFTGVYAQIEQGDNTARPDAKVVIATVQTMAHRMEKFGPDAFGLIICDEADRSMADTWMKVLAYFDNGKKVLGVTATPDRTDQRCVMNYYQRIAHETPLFDLIRRGYLSKIMVQTVPLEIDISKVRQIQGDYDKEELSKVLTPMFGKICEAIKLYASGRKILVFQPLIETSKHFVEVARDFGINAAHVDGAASDREHVKGLFRRKEVELLSNAMLLGRGYNDRSIDCIVNLRPTRSGSLYRQFVGRGTRTWCPHGCHERCEHADAKQNLLLLDFLWTFHKLGLVRPAHLIATSAEQAKKLTDYSARVAGEVLDLEGIDSRVAKEAELELLKQLARAKVQNGKYFDAMEFAVQMHQRELIEYEAVCRWEMKPLTEGMADALRKMGFNTDTIKGQGHAHKIFELARARREAGLATFKQVKLMRKFGVRRPDLVTFEAAGVYLDSCIKHIVLPEGFELYPAGQEPEAEEDSPSAAPLITPPTPQVEAEAAEEIAAFVDTAEGGEIIPASTAALEMSGAEAAARAAFAPRPPEERRPLQPIVQPEPSPPEPKELPESQAERTSKAGDFKGKFAAMKQAVMALD